jgi:murein L,D-transpeptidase YcbB/YkuD
MFRSPLPLAAMLGLALAAAPFPVAAQTASPVAAADRESASSNPLYNDLERALFAYRATWGSLPDVRISAGAALKPGDQGPRVAQLRRRLGLSEGTRFDEALADAVREYRQAHGLGTAQLADAPTTAALNRGPAYYERLIHLNLERARALGAEPAKRYILVDAAAARLWLYADGKPIDSMKVIVGAEATQTPVLTTSIGWAEINPFWNVPPHLVKGTVAPRVLSEGLSYLAKAGYEVMSDWTNDATAVDPATVDWKAVAAGQTKIRVRQRPGEANAMGEIKFVTNNDYGIFLHDTPNKALFTRDDRWLSNGCVRVEDAKRLARWLLGDIPAAPTRDKELLVPLKEPVTVQITYLTAAPSGDGRIVFRTDPYGRDAAELARLQSNAEMPRSASLMRSK